MAAAVAERARSRFQELLSEIRAEGREPVTIEPTIRCSIPVLVDALRANGLEPRIVGKGKLNAPTFYGRTGDFILFSVPTADLRKFVSCIRLLGVGYIAQ